MKALTRSGRRLGGAALACALLFTGACGGAKDEGDKSAPNTAGDPMVAFRSCMEKQGVTMPQGRGNRPSGRPSDAPTARPTDAPRQRPSNRPSMSAEQQKAMQACSSLAPQRNGRGGGPGGPEQNANNQ
ncbi:hypothetical protein [Actinomadura hibisca]|uniref:hypothetical protein n=1 Tax=Actinomadura hibisca TaxID=68565 RepID=UPI0008368643|nr:hypothetical protein [Actinomadura hibisca]